MAFEKGYIPWNKGKKGLFTMPKSAKDKISAARKRNGTSWSKGKHFSKTHRENIAKAKTGVEFSEEHLKNLSESHMGLQAGENHPMFGKHHSEDSRIKSSKSHTGLMAGDKHPMYGRKGGKNPIWKGGRKLSASKQNTKRRQLGFILITDKNPYNEEVEYHHIAKGFPYVIPCPKRLHKMFLGKGHWENLNAMLGIKFDLNELFALQTAIRGVL